MPERHDIAVLGPVPHDRITTWRGATLEKFGGALYTVAALASLVGAGSRIVPVTHVRKADREAVCALLRAMPHVETDRVSDRADRGDAITMRYLDRNRRVERQTGFMDPIVAEDVAGLDGFDAFVCVPITDVEVPLATLERLRGPCGEALVVFDAHGPTNARTARGGRAPRLWAERDRWLPHIDILKMNLEEAGRCWFGDERLAAPARVGPRSPGPGRLPMEELGRMAAHCLGAGVGAVCVTLDEHGCALWFRDADGRLRERLIGPVPAGRVVDTTGCGDAFAGGLAYGYLRTGDYVEACRYGNAIGSQRCTGTGLDVHPARAETERRMAETYPA